VPVELTKLSSLDAVGLIVGAGGQAVLAHPGFLVREAGVDLLTLLAELQPAGLSGLEVEYPYRYTGPHFADEASEREMVEELRRLAERRGLQATRGSDAHSVAQLGAFHGRPAG
jgi:predicted metal-dependent phosphoesterase TrpH